MTTPEPGPAGRTHVDAAQLVDAVNDYRRAGRLGSGDPAEGWRAGDALAAAIYRAIELGTDRPRAALIEIVERTDEPDPVVIVPNEVRIEGIPLLVAGDEPVVVHRVTTAADEAVLVTMSLYARRVVIGAEPKGPAS